MKTPIMMKGIPKRPPCSYLQSPFEENHLRRRCSSRAATATTAAAAAGGDCRHHPYLLGNARNDKSSSSAAPNPMKEKKKKCSSSSSNGVLWKRDTRVGLTLLKGKTRSNGEKSGERWCATLLLTVCIIFRGICNLI